MTYVLAMMGTGDNGGGGGGVMQSLMICLELSHYREEMPIVDVDVVKMRQEALEKMEWRGGFFI